MFNNTFKNKKVLITGHTGFKGSWLTTWLQSLGAQITGISLEIPTESHFEKLNLIQKITHHISDIRNYNEFKNIIDKTKPDFIFHLAAQAIVSEAYSNPLNTISTNIMGTANLLDILKSYSHPCTTVIITSDKCYENVEWKWGYRENDQLGGKDPYSASKAGAEIIFRSYFHSFLKDTKQNIASARAGNVIGGGDWANNRIIPDCIKSWANKTPVELRSPKSTRPWQHVLEPLSGYLCLAQKLTESKSLSGESYNFGPSSENSIPVLNLIKEISKHWKFNELDNVYTITDTSQFKEAGLLQLNCDKALTDLNWKPLLNIEETSKLTSQWYSHYYHEKSNIYELTTQQISEFESLATEKEYIWTT